MVEAELESRQPRTEGLGKQMRDPATAFPPLNKGIFALFGLVSDTRAPIETDKDEVLPKLQTTSRRRIHQPPDIFIFIGRDHRILKSESFEHKESRQRGWGSWLKSVWC